MFSPTGRKYNNPLLYQTLTPNLKEFAKNNPDLYEPKYKKIQGGLLDIDTTDIENRIFAQMSKDIKEGITNQWK